MKLSFGSALVATALMIGGSAVGTANAAPAKQERVAPAKATAAPMTDVSAQRWHRRGYYGGPRFYGPRVGYYGARYAYGPRFGYARPYYRPAYRSVYYGGYRPYYGGYGYGYRPAYYRPAYYGGYGYPYGGYGYGGPRIGIGFGPVGVSFGGFGW
jgi:hypothetical protein